MSLEPIVSESNLTGDDEEINGSQATTHDTSVNKTSPIIQDMSEEMSKPIKNGNSDNSPDTLKLNESSIYYSPEIPEQSGENETSDEIEDKTQESTIGDSNDKLESSDSPKIRQDVDEGDPIPSGTGTVSKDCSALDLLGWSEILPKWHSKLNHRPKGLSILVRKGVPEPLRGEIWQLLSGAQECFDLMEHYRIFLTKSAPTEQIILRDVHRTYPAHENFRTDSGSSSLLDSLFKVCKAYAVYDEEVGYCQGLSFLVAALLLHMPEEQAFCVFVRIMQHYGLRDLFRNNFDELYLKFYQLEHLLEDHMPDLYQHFSLIGIEPFTYASQWFLTVFTAKFPLNAVFYIMDIFLLDGMDTIFQIALALLSASKQDLLALDFEGVLKYFRVQMPKLYRNQEKVHQLIIASSEISLKRLKKHAKGYELMKQKERLLENPLTRLQRENAKLTENNLRLEQENDDLARDLVASKIQLRAQLDILEDKTETLNRALTYSRQDCQSYLNTISDMEDEKSRLEVEVSQLKEVCRRELNRAETESARDSKIIADYKRICTQLSKRLDFRLKCAREFVSKVQDSLRDNNSCNDKKCLELFKFESDKFIELLISDEQLASSVDIESSTDNKINESPQRNQRVSTESDPMNRPIGAYLKAAVDSKSTSSEVKIKQLTQHVDELEVELARTKLALVEAECKCQQLTHDISVGASVKTLNNNNNNDQSTAQPSGLSNKLDIMRAAMSTTRRSPKATSALAKINNLISEKISNISQTYPTSLSSSISTPTLASNVNVQNMIKNTIIESGEASTTVADIVNDARDRC